MKTTLKIPSILATITLTAAFALTGCGGGDDKRNDTVPQGFLPGGNNPVGTCGDGVNLAEYNAINSTMNREQIIAITCDQPTAIHPANGGSIKTEILLWSFGNATVTVEVTLSKSASVGTTGYLTEF